MTLSFLKMKLRAKVTKKEYFLNLEKCQDFVTLKIDLNNKLPTMLRSSKCHPIKIFKVSEKLCQIYRGLEFYFLQHQNYLSKPEIRNRCKS